MQQQHYRWAIISDYHFTYICRTPKCKGTLKSNGHAKNRWSAPNPDGVSSQSLMVCVELQKSVCSHSSPMVWHTKIRFYRPLIYNFKHLTLYKMDKNCSRLGSFVSLSLSFFTFSKCVHWPSRQSRCHFHLVDFEMLVWQYPWLHHDMT